ncbi:hypothetical protein [Halomarina ordinaria]|uniref:PD-(D/E)XK nuclease family protein n=1 Tax=Halomarina ordinaria TaxID=3033939 RepID=A0ABD5UHM0_9EURY|nr:hypothetical protein [Halomarina sp. PSRA2]
MGKRTFFRHISGEVPQNDFFLSLLAFSLDHGPEVLNAIHDDLMFSSDAEVIASQRNGLPRTPPDSGNYVLDWVVRDADKLVGYESKTGSDIPSDGQLDGELAKLEANNGGRDVYLYAFTDHHRNPIDRADVGWLSWYDVASRVQSLETINDSIKILQEMFDDNGYSRFSGFDEFEQSREWFLNHEEQIVKLAFEIGRRSEAFELYTKMHNQVPQHTTTKQLTKAFKNRARSLNQSVHAISYHPDESRKYATKGYNPCLLAPAITNEVGVYMHLNTAKTDEIETFVRGNASALTDLVNDHGMTLRTSWNNLNHPERKIKQYSDASEIERVLKNNVGSEYWKRLYFGWQMDTDQPAKELVAEATHRIDELHRLFFDPAEKLEDVPHY